MKAAAITIVVLNWNRRDDTLGCLDSLAQARAEGARVLVVDNGSRDGSVEAFRERFPDIQIIALPDNRGYAGGNNVGIRAALEGGAEGVILLNNDTRVAPDFLVGLLWTLDIYPRAGAVCAAIHRQDRPEMLDVAYAQVRLNQRHAVQLLGVNALPGDGFSERRQIEVAVGCCVLLTADALRTVGLFDEEYFAYHEDVDWSLRARNAGYQLFYEPLSRVFHRGSTTTAALQQTPAAGAERVQYDLPNAEALPWNPARTYLGARNLWRLLRVYATPAERRSFIVSCAYEIPLEVCAILLRREGWLRLGRFGYRDVLRPGVLLSLPRALRAAAREGRLAEMRAYLRGLWDGWRNTPLPLRDLGLVTNNSSPRRHGDTERSASNRHA